MNDLDLAKIELKKNKTNIVFAKDGKIIFSSSDGGVKGFITAIKKFGAELEDSSVADKIAGRAVAMLCLYATIKAIFAEIMSEGCIDILKKNEVAFEYKKTVPKILNRNKNNMCPLENLTTEVENPKIAFERLAKFLNLSV